MDRFLQTCVQQRTHLEHALKYPHRAAAATAGPCTIGRPAAGSRGIAAAAAAAAATCTALAWRPQRAQGSKRSARALCPVAQIRSSSVRSSSHLRRWLGQCHLTSNRPGEAMSPTNCCTYAMTARTQDMQLHVVLLPRSIPGSVLGISASG